MKDLQTNQPLFRIEQKNLITISVDSKEDGKFKILGFENYEQANNFLIIGDFKKQDNRYLSLNPKSDLIWTHEI